MNIVKIQTVACIALTTEVASSTSIKKNKRVKTLLILLKWALALLLSHVFNEVNDHLLCSHFVYQDARPRLSGSTNFTVEMGPRSSGWN